MTAASSKTSPTRTPLGWLDKLYVGILLIVFSGIVLHAPLSVSLGTVWPHYALFIKAWKEILLGAALLLLIVILTIRRQWSLFRSAIFYLIIAFALLNLAIIPVFHTGFQAVLAGILINLRYLLFFALVYAAIRLYPQLYCPFIYVFIGGMVVVIGFAVLQLTVLPHDVLKYLGYGKSTIEPYLTVDQNAQYVRINSTLRGPNPLGAYAIIVVATVLTLWLKVRKRLSKRVQWGIIILGVGALAALWASYSRSAELGALLAAAVVVVALYGAKLNRKVWLSVGVVAVIVVGGLVAFRHTQFVSQVIFHQDPQKGVHLNSDQGHAQSLSDGVKEMLHEPLGSGIGSTGSASLFGSAPTIVEDQYLFVAHETGWIGLVLFVWISGLVLVQLWHRRHHWLSLAVFASGIGLAAAGVVLPVWVDETVALIWWGAAAIALAMPIATEVVTKKIPRKKAG